MVLHANRNRKRLRRQSLKSKNSFYGFIEKSSLHGLIEIGTAQSVGLKTFWWIALLGGIGASIYGCYAIVSSYLKSPVVVSYVVHESRNLPLPDLVICPFNRLNASFLREHNISVALAAFIEMSFGFVGTPYTFQDGETSPNVSSEENLMNLQNLNKLMLQLNMTFSDLVHHGSLNCPGIIRHCVTSAGRFDCCADAVPTMTSVGKCYQLYGLPQRAAGYGFGITVIVQLPRDLYTPSVNNLHNDGIAVKLVEHGKGLDYDLTFVPSGVHALMPLRATQFDFIDNPPKYQCLKNTPEMRNYSRLSCFGECVFETGHSICGCSHVASLNTKYPACTTTEFYGCLIPETQTVLMENPNTDYVCYERCKPLCQYWQYSTSISYANFPSHTIRQFVENNEELEELKNSIILDVFYEKLEYTLIQHHPSMTVDTFIANLGGQLGLWVGGSILTLLQIIVYLIQLALAVGERSRWIRPENGNISSSKTVSRQCLQGKTVLSAIGSRLSAFGFRRHGFRNNVNHVAGERLSAYNNESAANAFSFPLLANQTSIMTQRL